MRAENGSFSDHVHKPLEIHQLFIRFMRSGSFLPMTTLDGASLGRHRNYILQTRTRIEAVMKCPDCRQMKMTNCMSGRESACVRTELLHLIHALMMGIDHNCESGMAI
jgi:hypothetical protein